MQLCIRHYALSPSAIYLFNFGHYPTAISRPAFLTCNASVGININSKGMRIGTIDYCALLVGPLNCMTLISGVVWCPNQPAAYSRQEIINHVLTAPGILTTS